MTRQINQIGLACCVLLSPAVISLPAALAAYLAYKYFNADIEIKPIWLEISIYSNALLSGVVCLLMFYFLIGKRLSPTLIISIPLMLWSFSKSIWFHDELLAFLGYSCCRDEATKLVNLLEAGLSPISPFYIFSYTGF